MCADYHSGRVNDVATIILMLLSLNVNYQGSIMSSTFCNTYLASIEKYLLSDVFEKDSSHMISCSSSTTDSDVLLVQSRTDLHLLVRIVDDFLLISTSKDTSARFLQKLNKGIPRIGVTINSDKSRVNYPLSLNNTDTGEMKPVHICRDSFPWCGLLINTRTCEMSLDHERFTGQQATNTVVVHRVGSEGLYLKKKMKDFVRPRCCQKLLFSSCVNGIDRIRSNFYETIVLCATKTAHYMTGSDASHSLKHWHYIYDSACDTVRFAFLLISSKLKQWKRVKHKSYQIDHAFQLAWNDALWLGKHAFLSVFQRKGPQYSKLCSLFGKDSRVLNRKDLLSASRQGMRMFCRK